MGDRETSARYRLVPLDKSGFVYLGLNATDGNQASLFVINAHHIPATVDPADKLFRDIIFAFLLNHLELAENYNHVSIDIDGKGYMAVPWNNEVDRTLVSIIDRLIDMRMKNASVVSMTLQLEMPLS